jgi:hypothetical protein
MHNNLLKKKTLLKNATKPLHRLSGFPLWLEPAGSFTGEFSPNPSLPEKYDFEV